MLVKCETCQVPRLDVEAFRAHNASIDALYVRIEELQAPLRIAVRDGTLTLESHLWPLLDELIVTRDSICRVLTEMRMMLRSLELDYANRRNETIKSMVQHQRPGQYEARGTAYEERAAIYDLQVVGEQLMLSSASQIVKSLEDLRWHIDRIYDHWTGRRVDFRWQVDRIAGPQAPQRNA